MKRRDFLKTAGLAAVGAAIPARFALCAGTSKRILYFDRSNNFVHPPTIERADGTTVCGEALKALGQKLGFEVDCSKDCLLFDGDLSKYGAFVFYTCGNLDQPDAEGKPGMSEQGIFNFYNAIRTGTGLIGIHSAADTWKTPGPLWENQPKNARLGFTNLIGGQFIIHGSQQETALRVVEKGLPFLGTQGDSFSYFDEWYALKNFNPDLHVLLVQETAGMNIDGGNACYNRPAFPSTWARREGKGRVCYTSLGHNDSSFWDPTMEGVMSDLLKLALQEVEIDLTPNLDAVCPGANTLKNG